MGNSSMRLQHGAKPMTRGIHHLALNTDDMKMTIDFYTSVLGMPLVHALKVPPGVGIGPANRGNPPFENLRHYFFDAGGDTLVAFFEMPKGAKTRGDRDALAAMQHCAFTTTEERFSQLLERLTTAGLPVIGPVMVGAGTWSVYFMDPNGIRLEFSWQSDDADDVRVVERWTQTQDEALAELASLSDDTAWLKQVTAHLPTRRLAAKPFATEKTMANFIPVNGLHHVAYRCRDAEETRHFYEDILGLPLTHVVRGDSVSTGEQGTFAHLFFEMTDGSSVAFFDLGDNIAAEPSPNTPRWVNHLALKVESEAEVDEARRRLQAAGVEVLGPILHDGYFRSIYFFDPNGIRLELTISTTTPDEVRAFRQSARADCDAWMREKNARLQSTATA